MVGATVGLAFAFGAQSSAALALGALLLFILGWDLSWAGLMLTLIAEVLPHEVRGVGTGLAYALYWVLSFVTAQFLESAFDAFGTAHTFGAIAVLCTCVLLWTWWCVPETANRSLNEIEVTANTLLDHVDKPAVSSVASTSGSAAEICEVAPSAVQM